MNGGEEIARELVVSCGHASEVLEPAEAAFDDVAALVEALVERMEDDAVGLIGDDRGCPAFDDVGPQFVAVIAFVGDEGARGGSLRQQVGRGGDVGSLPGGEIEDDWPAAPIAQAVDFGRAPPTRAADGLILLPPFPPEAQR
jgi:hypothetical protein